MLSWCHLQDTGVVTPAAGRSPSGTPRASPRRFGLSPPSPSSAARLLPPPRPPPPPHTHSPPCPPPTHPPLPRTPRPSLPRHVTRAGGGASGRPLPPPSAPAPSPRRRGRAARWWRLGGRAGVSAARLAPQWVGGRARGFGGGEAVGSPEGAAGVRDCPGPGGLGWSRGVTGLKGAAGVRRPSLKRTGSVSPPGWAEAGRSLAARPPRVWGASPLCRAGLGRERGLRIGGGWDPACRGSSRAGPGLGSLKCSGPGGGGGGGEFLFRRARVKLPGQAVLSFVAWEESRAPLSAVSVSEGR